MVSGGQTGADRGALDAALAAGVPVGGWCPGGRWAEDGRVPERYPLTPTPLRRPIQRTLRNLRAADAVLVLARGRPRGGSAALPRQAGVARPRLVLDPERASSPARAARFVLRHRPRALNVGGPRESEAPGIARAAERLVAALVGRAGRRGVRLTPIRWCRGAWR